MAVQVVDLVQKEASSLKTEARNMENLVEMASLARSVREQAGCIYIYMNRSTQICTLQTYLYTYVYTYVCIDFASKICLICIYMYI